jgi:hypothetical protein
MTEAQWLSSSDPTAMLRSLTARYAALKRRGETPDIERLRLFACACCRRVWELLDDEHRKSVEMIEEYVRTPTRNGLRAARRVRWAAGNKTSNDYDRISRASPRDRRACLAAWARNIAASAVWQAADKSATKAACCHREVAQAVDSIRLSEGASANGPDPGYIGYELPPDGELVVQATLLREIVRNPFALKPPVGV